MPDIALDKTARILGRSLITAETIYSEIRERLVNELAKRAKYATFQEVLSIARAVLSDAEPIFAEHLADTDIAAWLAGYHWTSQQFPFWLNREFLIINEGPPKPPSGKITWPWGDGEPTVRFPLLEKAAESLEERGILTREEFDLATAQAKMRSFTMAGENTTDTLEAIRDALATDVTEGTSLRGFREKFAQIVDASSLGPAHVENVYRTNVQAAFRDGRETLAANPIVNEVFPYQEYFAIHDARVREHHLALETLGLNGTAIYRRDDPFWERWTPPNGFSCRCGVSLLTLADAARKGVLEAQQWLETGSPPATPEWRFQFIPFENEPGFGGRGRVVAMAIDAAGHQHKGKGEGGGQFTSSGESTGKTGGAMHAWAAKRFKDPKHAANFAKWFGQSKVVNENGEPLVMYHGTQAGGKIDSFKSSIGEIGIHFGTAQQARSRLEDTNAGDGSATYPVYLSIENPLRLDDLGTWTRFTMPDALVTKGVMTKSEKLKLKKEFDKQYETLKRNLPVPFDSTAFHANAEIKEQFRKDVNQIYSQQIDQIQSFLKAKGYDGIVYANKHESLVGRQDSYIAFDPNQIKSASGNRGTFDPKDNKITMAVDTKTEPGG